MSAGPYSIGSKHWPGISKLIEEAGEVQQVCGKLLGSGGDPAHFDGSDLRARLVEEMGDLLAALGFVADKCGLDQEAIAARAATKRALFERWHAAEGA